MPEREKPPVGAILLNPFAVRRISTDSSVDNVSGTDIKQLCASNNQRSVDGVKEEYVLTTDEESNSFLPLNSKVVNTSAYSPRTTELCAASKIQSGHHRYQVAKDNFKFPESESKSPPVNDAESSLSLLDVVKHNTQHFIGSSQTRKRKKTVLPQGLLDKVTDRVKQQRDILAKMEPVESYKEEKGKKTAVTARISTTFPGNMRVQAIHSESTMSCIDTRTCNSEKIAKVTFDYEFADRKHCNFQDAIDKGQLQATCTEKAGNHNSSNIGNSVIKEPVDESVDVLVVETSMYHDASKYETGSEAKHITEVTDTSIDGKIGKRYKSEKKKANKRRRSKSKSKIKNQKGSTSEDMAAQRWNNSGPSHFISIQITNSEIHDALSMVQDEVLEGNPLLSPAMINLPRLHLTMMLLRLDNGEEISRAKRALENIKDKLLTKYSNKTLQLNVCGLGNFNDEVVFAKIKGKEQLQKLEEIAGIVKECFMNEELEYPNANGFKPHITVMKMSQAKHLRDKGIQKIDENLYRKFRETDFGVEHATTIQLCAMRMSRSGYYQIEHEVNFTAGQ